MSGAATDTGPAERTDGRARGETLVQIEGLKTHYPIHAGILRRVVGFVYAVDGVTFEIRRGEILGLVGESGCGKTTLGRTLLQLETRTEGAVRFENKSVFDAKGRDLKLLRRRMQVIFQDPVSSLNPRMPVSDIIGEGLLAQADEQNQWGKRSVRDDAVGDALEAVKLRRDYARRYPHEFSGGQRQRIGIARAIALKPDFIFADEPVSALDVSIQSQILNLLVELRDQFELTYLFVAHNLSVVQYISDRVGVMYLGKLVELSPVAELYEHPRHPYTVALLSAVPNPDPRVRRKRIVLQGDVPSPAAPPSGCRFHTRCWLREQLGNPENCEREDPEFRDLGDGHRVACHWSDRTEDTLRAIAPPVVGTAVAPGPEPSAPAFSREAAATAPEGAPEAPQVVETDSAG